MPYVYLISSVFCSASSSVFGTYFNRKNEGRKDTSAFYNLLLMASVFICWAVYYAFDFSFTIKVLPYSLLFALCYTICNLGLINALKCGPSSLTTLFVSLSTILTTVWGFIFWDSNLTLPVLGGLLLVVISLILCLYTGKKEEKKISAKWIFYVILALFGNAGCSITQRTQQMHFNGGYAGELMAFATLFSCIVCFIIWLKSDKTDSRIMWKGAGHFPIIAGIANMLLNYFVVLLAMTKLSPSLIYPVIGVGSLAVVILFSLFAFKEKLKYWQWTGLAIGAIATVLISN